MIRKIFIVVLALLALGTCLAWVCQPDSLALVDLQETEAGRLESHWVVFLHPGGLNISYGPYTWWTHPRQYFRRFAGFGYAHHTTTNQEYRELKTPYWALLLLFITCPTIAFIRGPLRRHRRRKRGLCLTCGYDLRASPDRCPECGVSA